MGYRMAMGYSRILLHAVVFLSGSLNHIDAFWQHVSVIDQAILIDRLL